MSIRLEKCTSCARHVRQSEASCPFCGAVLPASFRVPRARPSPARGLSRAALWALGASSVGLVAPLAACSGDDTTTADDAGSLGAAYGGSSPELDAGHDATTRDAAPDAAPPSIDAAEDAPIMTQDAAYGAPPPRDAGEDAGDSGALDASDSGDAGGR